VEGAAEPQVVGHDAFLLGGRGTRPYGHLPFEEANRFFIFYYSTNVSICQEKSEIRLFFVGAARTRPPPAKQFPGLSTRLRQLLLISAFTDRSFIRRLAALAKVKISGMMSNPLDKISRREIDSGGSVCYTACA
jgi:hypothetical protein